MQLPSIQAANDSNGPLLSIPVELMTEILSALPSFFDVLALAATCRQLRHIWTTNVTSIYSQVASRSVPCERYARRFLADHGGLATSFSTPSARDALCILRNSCVVEKAILKFEKDIVCRIQTQGVPTELLEKCYGARKHPPNLTRTERLRFIRSYYQFWGMMELKYPEWQSRLESMTSLKNLYLLHEISKLRQSIGMEQVRPDPWFPGAELSYICNIRKKRSTKHVFLRNRIWQRIKHIFQHFHDREPDPVWDGDHYEGAYGFIVMWDQWQPPREYISCGRRPIDPSTWLSFEEQYLWEDNSDEETYYNETQPIYCNVRPFQELDIDQLEARYITALQLSQPINHPLGYGPRIPET